MSRMKIMWTKFEAWGEDEADTAMDYIVLTVFVCGVIMLAGGVILRGLGC